MGLDNCENKEFQEMLDKGWKAGVFPKKGFQYLESPSGRKYNLAEIRMLQSEARSEDSFLSPEESDALKLHSLSSRLYNY